MFASYQNNNLLQSKQSNYDGSITDLDSQSNTQTNLLSYFNFMSSSNKHQKIKYYAVASVIGVLLILLLLHITSSGSSAVSSPLLSPTNDVINPWSTELCTIENYWKKTVKELDTSTIGSLIPNAHHAKKYEASGLIYDSSRDVYWVVFDSLYAIGKLTSDLTRNEHNLLVVSDVNGMNENENGLESGYEGITRDTETDIIYLLTEAVEFTDNKGKTVYHPVIRSVTYDEQETYSENQICAVDFLDASDNKGFESLNLIIIEGQKYFVGLCEGNYCDAGKRGRTPGHGRMVLLNFEPETVTAADTQYKYLLNDNIDCVYKVIDKYNLPKYIDFIDYSAFHIQPKEDSNNGYFDIVIVSQERAALWIGEVAWTTVAKGPDFSVNLKDGKTYSFPRNDNCERIFCNVEGITFSNDNQLVAVSDKAKGGGKQGYICGQYDQSVHIFQVP